MELHLLVLRERKNIFLARQISARQRGAVMAFIPDLASLLSLLVETDYNFKKITAVFFGSCLKKFHSVGNCLFIKQNAKLFQHNHLLFEICWGYLFCSIRLSSGCPFHPVESKSCNRTEFGRTYRTYRIFTVL